MIIKSKSRTNKSFSSLYDYMSKDKSNLYTYNLYSNAYDKERTIKEFMENAKELDKSRGKNYLYHEIISLEKDLNISEERKKEILLDLSEKYINQRAKDHLVLKAIHTDKEHTHIHLMISANSIGSNNRERLSKKEFANIQKNLEEYKNSKYPFLQTEHYQEKNQQSQKDQLKEKLKNIFESKHQKEFEEKLNQENIKIYKRGQAHTVDFNGKKYRLKNLSEELNKTYTKLKDNLHQQPKKTNEQQTKQQKHKNFRDYKNNEIKDEKRYNYREKIINKINQREQELKQETKEQDHEKSR